MGGGEIENPFAIEKCQGVGDHQETVGRVALHRRESLREIVGLAHPQRLDCDAERLCRRGRSFVAHAHPQIRGVPKHGDPLQLGRRILEQFETLGGKFGRHVGNPGDVAARPVKAGNQTRPDRIAGVEDDDRNRAGAFFRRGGDRIAECDNHIDLGCDQLRHQSWQTVGMPVRAALDQLEIGAKPCLGKPADDFLGQPSGVAARGETAGAEEADAIDFRLRVRRSEAQDRSAANQGKKIAAPHSITSSALANSVHASFLPVDG
jgi:hypothetical protein